MKSFVLLHFRLARPRFHLAAAALIALLQRTPVVRVVALADELVSASPLGSVLKSAAAVAASLGAVHSLAGATVLVASQSSPVSTKVGTSSTQVAFTVTNTINIASWKIGGTLPPGMTISATLTTGPEWGWRMRRPWPVSRGGVTSSRGSMAVVESFPGARTHF